MRVRRIQRPGGARHPSTAVGGFTLVEVLAVVALLSLLAGLITVRLSATSATASFHGLQARLMDLDARARLFARAGEPVILSVPGDGGAVELRGAFGGETIVRVSLDNDATLTLRTDPESDWLLYDRRGLTRDHTLELARGGQRASWRVSGESGWIEALPTEEEDG